MGDRTHASLHSKARETLIRYVIPDQLGDLHNQKPMAAGAKKKAYAPTAIGFQYVYVTIPTNFPVLRYCDSISIKMPLSLPQSRSLTGNIGSMADLICLLSHPCHPERSEGSLTPISHQCILSRFLSLFGAQWLPNILISSSL